MDNFFAIMSRMKYINRWNLMRNQKSESLSEHTFEVAYITHALVEMHNARGGNVNAGEAVLYALYHDVTETLTGDMPTPVKYHNEELHTAYKKVEQFANEKLCNMLPEELRGKYEKYLFSTDKKIVEFVKAADKLSALVKCIDERQMGNADFEKAEAGLRKKIYEIGLPEATEFMEKYIDSYGLCVDEL